MKYIIIGIVGLILGVVGAVIYIDGKTVVINPVGGEYNQNVFQKVATSSAMTIGTSSSDLIATSTNRIYLRITNTDANYVCLSLDSDKAAVNCQGIYLAASGGTYEMTGANLYTGAINAISNTAASVLTIVEATR